MIVIRCKSGDNWICWNNGFDAQLECYETHHQNWSFPENHRDIQLKFYLRTRHAKFNDCQAPQYLGIQSQKVSHAASSFWLDGRIGRNCHATFQHSKGTRLAESWQRYYWEVWKAMGPSVYFDWIESCFTSSVHSEPQQMARYCAEMGLIQNGQLGQCALRRCIWR